jgi:hypothetical protein
MRVRSKRTQRWKLRWSELTATDRIGGDLDRVTRELRHPRVRYGAEQAGLEQP